MKLPRFFPLLLLIAAAVVRAQDNDQCSSPDQASELQIHDFDSISMSWDHYNCEEGKSPKTIHWHLYIISNDGGVQQPSKISMFPPGFLNPFVDNYNTGLLQFRLDRDIISNYTQNASVPVVVNFYIPAKKISGVDVRGVGHVVEIFHRTSTESLTIRNTGANITIYVTSPAAAILYVDSGSNNVAHIDAGADSSVGMTGVDGYAYIAVPDDQLTVRTDGFNSTVLIQGKYKQVRMIGVNDKVLVNGDSCDGGRVRNRGIRNSCSETTTETVQVDTISCLVTAGVEENNDCSRSSHLRFLSTGGLTGSILVWFMMMMMIT